MRADGSGRTGAGIRRPIRAATVAVAALAIAGCSWSEDPPASTTTQVTATSGTTSTTTAVGTTSTTARTSGTTPGSRPPGSAPPRGTTPRGTTPDGDIVPNSELEADEEADTVTWNLNAEDYAGRTGLLVAYDCTPDGLAASVWGDGFYTDDSSVCTAAVHAGLIDFEDGGRVVIQIEPGQSSYASSTANGVTTLDYRSWPGSFSFPGA